MVVPSPLGDVKNSVPNQYFRAKYIDTQIKCFFCEIVRLIYFSQNRNLVPAQHEALEITSCELLSLVSGKK